MEIYRTILSLQCWWQSSFPVYLPLKGNLPKFCRDIISHWQKIKNTDPKIKEDVLNEIIWNNQFIRVNKFLFSPGKKKVGIENSRAFFTTKWHLNCLLSQISCRNTTSRVIFYRITVFYLQCHWIGMENYVKARMFSTIN